MKRLSTICVIAILIVTLLCPVSNASQSEIIKNYMYNNYSKALKLSGMKNFYNYCAACVSYQLMTSGITKQYTYFNGNQAYDSFASGGKTTGGYSVYKYPASAYSMQYVLNSMNTLNGEEKTTPVLIGFNRGTASNAGQTYGHTLLIYAVNNSLVYFTESMNPTIDENMLVLSIDDFCARYSDDPNTPKTEFQYEGAVVFYNYKPFSPSISTLKNIYSAGENVTFYFSSPGATKYYIGINKDGQRIITTSATSGYSVALSEPGSYTAYVSCCNVYGYADSESISFEVIPVFPSECSITSDKSTVSSGDTVTLNCHANNATAYFVGITAPDGSYTVLNTNGKTNCSFTPEIPGTYTVFATCCNVYGYTDTSKITISVE